MIKVCKHHGETEYRHDGHTFRCKKCDCEKVIRRRRKVKEKLIQEFGGACKLCGYNKCQEALHFHHLDPATKEFCVCNRLTSYEKVIKEAKKCILLCGNCHAEVETLLVGNAMSEAFPKELVARLHMSEAEKLQDKEQALNKRDRELKVKQTLLEEKERELKVREKKIETKEQQIRIFAASLLK